MYNVKHSQVRLCLICINTYFHNINILEYLSYKLKILKIKIVHWIAEKQVAIKIRGNSSSYFYL